MPERPISFSDLLRSTENLQHVVENEIKATENSEREMLSLMEAYEGLNNKTQIPYFMTLGQGVDRMIISRIPAIFIDYEDKKIPAFNAMDRGTQLATEYKSSIIYPVLNKANFYGFSMERYLDETEISERQERPLDNSAYVSGIPLIDLFLVDPKFRNMVRFTEKVKKGGNMVRFSYPEGTLLDSATILDSNTALRVLLQINEVISERSSKKTIENQNIEAVAIQARPTASKKKRFWPKN